MTVGDSAKLIGPAAGALLESALATSRCAANGEGTPNSTKYGGAALGLDNPAEKLMKPTITWIVLADGDQAKIFENGGPGKGLHALKDMAMAQDHLAAHDIMADRPGRSSNPAGPGSRAAVDYRTDPVDLRERRFLEGLAKMLEDKQVAGAYDRLVIVAPPRALGELRPALSENVRTAILAELPKELMHLPTEKLGEHLSDVMAI